MDKCDRCLDEGKIVEVNKVYSDAQCFWCRGRMIREDPEMKKRYIPYQLQAAEKVIDSYNYNKCVGVFWKYGNNSKSANKQESWAVVAGSDIDGDMLRLAGVTTRDKALGVIVEMAEKRRIKQGLQ
jgi:hypothetical protein